MGNCWLVSAVGVLAAHPTLLEKVIPSRSAQEFPDSKTSRNSECIEAGSEGGLAGNSGGLQKIKNGLADADRRFLKRENIFGDVDHPGIFEFRFFRFGNWYSVVVDEYLPVVNGELVFGHSTHKSEFWPALLEKAYAKINGSYEALEEGSSEDAIVDLTGCVPEHFEIRSQVSHGTNFIDEFFKITHKAIQRGDLITCSIDVDNDDEREALTDKGLITGHSYGVHDVRVISSDLLPDTVRMNKDTDCEQHVSPESTSGQTMPLSPTLSNSSNPSSIGSFGKNSLIPSAASSTGGDKSSVGFSFRKAVRDWFHEENKEAVRLIKLRNPWGKSEWCGPWSESSNEWKSLPASLRRRLSLHNENQGDFWMPYEDFINQFTSVFLCRMYNTSVWRINHLRWYTKSFFGAWSKKPPPWGVGVPNTAGGCINYPETFANNPQYVFTIHQRKITMIVSLMQRDQRSDRHLGKENATIGFVVMQIERNRRLRIKRPYPVTTIVPYVNSREVFHRFVLKEGRYVLIPTAFEPGEEADYFLRIFTSQKVRIRQLERDRPTIDWFSASVGRIFAGVLRVFIHSAQHVRVNTGCTKFLTYVNPFVVLASSDDKAWYLVGGYLASELPKTRTQYDTQAPTFSNENFVFYIKNPDKACVSIKLMSEGFFTNSVLGENYIKVSTFARPGKRGRICRVTLPMFCAKHSMKEHERRWRQITGLHDRELAAEEPRDPALVVTDPFNMFFAAWANLDHTEAAAENRVAEVDPEAKGQAADGGGRATGFRVQQSIEAQQQVAPQTTALPPSAQLAPGTKAAFFEGSLEPEGEWMGEAMDTRTKAVAKVQQSAGKNFRRRLIANHTSNDATLTNNSECKYPPNRLGNEPSSGLSQSQLARPNKPIRPSPLSQSTGKMNPTLLNASRDEPHAQIKNRAVTADAPRGLDQPYRRLRSDKPNSSPEVAKQSPHAITRRDSHRYSQLQRRESALQRKRRTVDPSLRKSVISMFEKKQELLEGTIVYHDESNVKIVDPRGIIETGVPPPFNDSGDVEDDDTDSDNSVEDILVPELHENGVEGKPPPIPPKSTERKRVSTQRLSRSGSVFDRSRSLSRRVAPDLVDILCPKTGKMIKVTPEQREAMMREPLTEAFVVRNEDGSQAYLETVKAQQLRHDTLCPTYLEEIDACAMLTMYIIYEDGLTNA